MNGNPVVALGFATLDFSVNYVRSCCGIKYKAARDFKPKVLDSTEILKAIEKEATRLLRCLILRRWY